MAAPSIASTPQTYYAVVPENFPTYKCSEENINSIVDALVDKAINESHLSDSQSEDRLSVTIYLDKDFAVIDDINTAPFLSVEMRAEDLDQWSDLRLELILAADKPEYDRLRYCYNPSLLDLRHTLLQKTRECLTTQEIELSEAQLTTIANRVSNSVTESLKGFQAKKDIATVADGYLNNMVYIWGAEGESIKTSTHYAALDDQEIQTEAQAINKILVQISTRVLRKAEYMDVRIFGLEKTQNASLKEKVLELLTKKA